MKMTQKEIGYAYPSSDAAEWLGFGKEGCYTVETVEYENGVRQPPKKRNYLAGFITKEGAEGFLQALQEVKHFYRTTAKL